MMAGAAASLRETIGAPQSARRTRQTPREVSLRRHSALDRTRGMRRCCGWSGRAGVDDLTTPTRVRTRMRRPIAMNAEFAAKNAENPSEIQTRRSLRPRRSSSDADSLRSSQAGGCKRRQAGCYR